MYFFLPYELFVNNFFMSHVCYRYKTTAVFRAPVGYCGRCLFTYMQHSQPSSFTRYRVRIIYWFGKNVHYIYSTTLIINLRKPMTFERSSNRDRIRDSWNPGPDTYLNGVSNSRFQLYRISEHFNVSSWPWNIGTYRPPTPTILLLQFCFIQR